MTYVCGRTNSHIRSPRRKAFGSMDECKQGKSTSSIRNFGKRIGFVKLTAAYLSKYGL